MTDLTPIVEALEGVRKTLSNGLDLLAIIALALVLDVCFK